ncbi:alpha/beta hydrolase [Delftia sp. WSY_14]|uniref:alpha/beta hydrolase n=1 Tax=unclassified Delftia TaxID=2613839 RepID=UPI00370B7503
MGHHKRIAGLQLPEQPTLPFASAQEYEDQVLSWAAEDLVHAKVRALRDVAYGTQLGQRYDVFLPPHVQGAPVLVFWHGGGWTNGYKEYVSFMAPAVTGLGMVLVAPGYRLAPDHRLPAACADSLAALRTSMTQCARLGADTGRIFLAGHSAGGHLAALLALRHAGTGLAGIRACLPISGIMDLRHAAPEAGSLEERVYTMVLDRREDDLAHSPVHWAAASTTAMHLSWGEHDSERVQRSNRELGALLAQASAPHSMCMQPGLDHFSTHTCLRDPQAPWYGHLARLLKETAA